MTIEEYQNKMMALAEKDLPKESKNFLKTEAQKLKRHMQSYANANVPVSRIAESDAHKKYHTSFKTGKTYKYNEAYAKRVFNASGHGRYVEYGRTVAKGYKKSEGYKKSSNILGKSKHYEVVKHVKTDFDPIYYNDVDAWIEKMIQEGKL